MSISNIHKISPTIINDNNTGGTESKNYRDTTPISDLEKYSTNTMDTNVTVTVPASS